MLLCLVKTSSMLAPNMYKKNLNSVINLTLVWITIVVYQAQILNHVIPLAHINSSSSLDCRECVNYELVWTPNLCWGWVRWTLVVRVTLYISFFPLDIKQWHHSMTLDIQVVCSRCFWVVRTSASTMMVVTEEKGVDICLAGWGEQVLLLESLIWLSGKKGTCATGNLANYKTALQIVMQFKHAHCTFQKPIEFTGHVTHTRFGREGGEKKRGRRMCIVASTKVVL